MKALVLSNQKAGWKEIIDWIGGLGGEVVDAASSRQALKILDNDRKIDMVFVSADDNEVSTALLRNIKSNHRLSNLPVIAVGYGFDDDAVRGFLSQDVDDIMVLPISQDTFNAKVQKAKLSGRRTVLVVDDEETIRDLLSNFLELERYDSLLAESAEEALEILKEHPVDAVVTDIIMSGMTGMQLLEEVKLNYPGIPVILITGYAGTHTPNMAIEMGADGFFAKPFHNVDLIYTLRRLLGKRRRVSAIDPPSSDEPSDTPPKSADTPKS